MGQYWKLVNIDKKEVVHPHDLGCGLKMTEQMGTSPGTQTALMFLVCAMPERRGGGDFNPDHEIAKKVVGRWVGDRVMWIGDYAENDDYPEFNALDIYEDLENYLDISDLVAKMIEYEFQGKYEGEGWKEFKFNKNT